MNQLQPNIPFYLQMVSLLRNALDLLDELGQQEVFQFLKSQQNVDGGFMDRGGQSDLYYSLFGMLLLRAIESEVRSQKSEVEKAKSGGAFQYSAEFPLQIHIITD